MGFKLNIYLMGFRLNIYLNHFVNWVMGPLSNSTAYSLSHLQVRGKETQLRALGRSFCVCFALSVQVQILVILLNGKYRRFCCCVLDTVFWFDLFCVVYVVNLFFVFFYCSCFKSISPVVHVFFRTLQLYRCFSFSLSFLLSHFIFLLIVSDFWSFLSFVYLYFFNWVLYVTVSVWFFDFFFF